MSEQNKAIARRFLQEQDRLKGVADDLCAPSYKFTLGSNPPMDLAGHKELAKEFYGGFPDLKQTVEDTIAEGDRVAVRITATGTHTGSLMGIPATRKPIKVSGISLFRIANGKVAELREEFDQVGIMQQIGVMPAPK